MLKAGNQSEKNSKEKKRKGIIPRNQVSGYTVEGTSFMSVDSELGMVVPACNPSTQQAEAGGPRVPG
jgi:hypothetical protein